MVLWYVNVRAALNAMHAAYAIQGTKHDMVWQDMI